MKSLFVIYLSYILIYLYIFIIYYLVYYPIYFILNINYNIFNLYIYSFFFLLKKINFFFYF